MKKELTIDQAIERIERESKHLRKPVLVSVCGIPDSGKTFFQWKARERLPNVGITASHDSQQAYANAHTLDFLFIHAMVDHPEDVSEQTRRYVGRDTDFDVFIYNPTNHAPNIEELRQDYDLIVRNECGVHKKNL